MADNIYTRFGFTRRQHLANKAGKYAELWQGQIILATDTDAFIDEIEAARDFEALVVSSSIPMHGFYHRLAYINFNYSPTSDDKDSMGEGVKCIATIGYLSSVERMNTDEIQHRVTTLLGGKEL